MALSASADSDEAARAIVAHGEINVLQRTAAYDDADRVQILELLTELGLRDSDEGNAFVMLRQNRGQLVRRGQDDTVEVVARGRGDWVGWVELKTEAVNEVSTQNTARVITQGDADILALIAAESRHSLRDFSRVRLRQIGGQPYEHTMLIEGNDGRGIDVGLLTKSKRGGGNAQRLRQAARVKEIVNDRLAQHPNLVVPGDLNDTPDSDNLKPLLTDTPLKDISTRPNFDDGGFPGTFGTQGAANRIDYLLLSSDLMDNVSAGGIFRRGVFSASHRWPVFDTVTATSQQASDHAAIWGDIDLL